ncbi:unnamed protein product [Auanema sp. JU1783]|nr:unnamed protein product [Auanema sp. JU1783]
MASGPKEDVYESEGACEGEKNVFAREESNDPDVELVYLDIDSARKRYVNCNVNSAGVDFSDSIAKKKKKCYGSNSYVLEVTGKEYEEPETDVQRINRLTCEINELHDKLNADESPEGKQGRAAISKLMEELKTVSVLKKSGAPTRSSEVSTKKAEATSSANSDSKVISLEKRVKRLEALVGSFDSTKPPLVDALEDLKFRTESLNPTIVEGLETRVNQIMTKVQQIEEKREKSIDSETETNARELLDLMNKWDVACSALPSNLKKIQALSKLHEQAASFSQRLTLLAGVREQMERSMKADKDMMERLQGEAATKIEKVMSGIKILEGRVEQLKSS